MDHNRTPQRGRRPPVPQGRVDIEEVFGEDEYNDYDEMWPERSPSSALSYQRLADVETTNSTTRLRGDANSSQIARGYRTSNPGRERGEVNTSVPSRRTGSQSQLSPASQLARRTATHTNLPAIPASQPARRTGSYTKTGNYENIPALSASQISRRTSNQGQGYTPASQMRTRTSSPRYTAPAPTPAPSKKRRYHLLVFIGTALLVMVVGWVLLSAFLSWWHVTQDDLTYGRPRTSHYSAVVGHNDATTPSDFVAMNLHRHIEVIEFPGGDPTKAKIYVVSTLIGPDQDLTPVTLTFKDVNGDGKVDMIVNVQTARIVYINENGQFRLAHAGDKIYLG